MAIMHATDPPHHIICHVTGVPERQVSNVALARLRRENPGRSALPVSVVPTLHVPPAPSHPVPGLGGVSGTHACTCTAVVPHRTVQQYCLVCSLYLRKNRRSVRTL